MLILPVEEQKKKNFGKGTSTQKYVNYGELVLLLRARSQSFLSNGGRGGNILHSSSFLKPAPTFKFQATPRKGLEPVKGRKTIAGRYTRSLQNYSTLKKILKVLE